jgi:hypothetical protein
MAGCSFFGRREEGAGRSNGSGWSNGRGRESTRWERWSGAEQERGGGSGFTAGERRNRLFFTGGSGLDGVEKKDASRSVYWIYNLKSRPQIFFALPEFYSRAVHLLQDPCGRDLVISSPGRKYFVRAGINIPGRKFYLQGGYF